MDKEKPDLKDMSQVYAIGEEGAFAVMAARLKAGAEMQMLDWNIIEDHISSIEWLDDDGYHVIFHYLGTFLVSFSVSNDDDGAIIIRHPETPGERVPDSVLS